MVNVYDAEDILAVKKCGDLFTNNIDTLKKEYRMLVKMWHPDVNTDKYAKAVMQHITTLYEHATVLIKKGLWDISNQFSFISDKDETILINFQLEKSFELGRYFICSNKVVYVVDIDKKPFVNNATNIINSFKFADDKMKDEIQKLLPKINKYYLTKDGKYVIVEIPKTSDMLPLSEILKYYDNKIPHRHVAWIMSRLNNLICYLQWSGLAHNGISLDTCFISPFYHSVVIYGGWWYTTPIGESIKGTSLDVYNAMPFSVKNKKISSILTDIESAKVLCKRLLDCEKSFNKDKEVPVPFVDYLNKTTSKTAFENYNEWNQVLTDAYGVRKFVKMEVTENELYSG